MNFRLLLYSLSPIFYFFLSVNLITRVLDILNYKYKPLLIYLIFFGSGVSYYAFERFSMTHVYESFSVILIFYLSLKYFNTPDSKLFGFLIPFVIALGISVKWVNYFLFLIPFFAKKLLLEKGKVKNGKLLNNKFFILSSYLDFFISNTYKNFVWSIYI